MVAKFVPCPDEVLVWATVPDAIHGTETNFWQSALAISMVLLDKYVILIMKNMLLIMKSLTKPWLGALETTLGYRRIRPRCRQQGYSKY